MGDKTCMVCGRIIPEGRHICLSCEGQNEMQRFTDQKPSTAAQKKKPVTNGDKIRQMTDEQLATIVGRCLFCIYYHEPDCGAYDCYEGRLAYIKKEADEDG